MDADFALAILTRSQEEEENNKGEFGDVGGSVGFSGGLFVHVDEEGDWDWAYPGWMQVFLFVA